MNDASLSRLIRHVAERPKRFHVANGTLWVVVALGALVLEMWWRSR